MKITVTPRGFINLWDKDNKPIKSYAPRIDLEGLPEIVKEEAEKIWTEEVVNDWIGYINNSINETINQKLHDAEDEAKKIAMEELLAERIDTPSLDKVKSEIEKGNVTDARKAVRDEHKKLKG